MTVKLKIKEEREKLGISIRELSEMTGIERHRLSKIEEDVDEILFIEMLVISQNLGISILNLYELGKLDIKGIGEI